MKIPKLYLTVTPSGGSFVYGIDDKGIAWHVQLDSRGRIHCLVNEGCPPRVGVNDSGWVTQELSPVPIQTRLTGPPRHSSPETNEFVKACEDLGI